jgi:hypothetical protein
MATILSRLARRLRILYTRWSNRGPMECARDPCLMPAHLFHCLSLDYSSAVRADITRQNYSMHPRHWYINAAYKCTKCGDNFLFTVEEQLFWYEGLQFYVDSVPIHCQACRKILRLLKSLRKEYDAKIASALGSDDLVEKRRLINVIDELSEASAGLPAQIIQNRRTLARQISQIGGKGKGDAPL